MKKIAPFVFAAICACALFMAGCSCSVNVVTDKNTSNTNQAATQPSAKRGTVASYDVLRGDVTIEGSTIAIVLDGNPTTGYEWTAQINGDNLKAVSESFDSSSRNPVAAGAGGNYTFTFEGIGTGTGTLKLTYARSWETTSSDEWVQIDVVTKGGKISDTVATCSDGTKSESHS